MNQSFRGKMMATCPKCGMHIEYVEQYAQWYCYSCGQYLQQPQQQYPMHQFQPRPQSYQNYPQRTKSFKPVVILVIVIIAVIIILASVIALTVWNDKDNKEEIGITDVNIDPKTPTTGESVEFSWEAKAGNSDWDFEPRVVFNGNEIWISEIMMQVEEMGGDVTMGGSTSLTFDSPGEGTLTVYLYDDENNQVDKKRIEFSVK